MRRQHGRAGSLWTPGSFRARTARALVFGYPPSGGLAIATSAPAPPPVTFDFYVSPTGGTGTGAITDPWSLTYALAGAGGAIVPGKTIALRGGTYTGTFSCALNGTSANPITFRQYPGERATIDGSIANITGSYTWWWGFEVFRSVALGNNVGGVSDFGLNNRLINLVVHDASGVGIGSNDANSGGEVTGCLVYNNGFQFNFNHGMYIHNALGNPLKTLRDNIVFNNWTNNIQVFATASGFLDNITVDGNVCFGAATISLPTNKAADLLLLGPAAQRMQVTNTYTYEVASSQNVALWLGDHTDDLDLIATGNIIIGGGNKALNLGPWATATISQNTLYIRSGEILLSSSPFGGYTWSQNVHYRDSGAPSWSLNGTDLTYAAWKAGSGLGGSDTNPSIAPTTTQVFVRANPYESGRANIVIYNWAGTSSVSVDLSTILTAGQNYDVFNAQDFYGGAVVSGTYVGVPVVLPMAGITPVQPLWRSYTLPPITGPTFQAFVVRLQGA